MTVRSCALLRGSADADPSELTTLICSLAGPAEAEREDALGLAAAMMAADGVGAVLGLGLGGRLRPGARDERRRRGEGSDVSRCPRAAGARSRPPRRQAREGRVVGAVAGGDADAPAVHDAQVDDRVVLRDVLVDLVVGEAGERAVGADDERLRLRRASLERHRDGALGDRRGRRSDSLTAVPTPTWTSRKRAPLQPWPTCMPWPGWPLPQFVMPTSIQLRASATASQEPQNIGVMPVYVALR